MKFVVGGEVFVVLMLIVLVVIGVGVEFLFDVEFLEWVV